MFAVDGPGAVSERHRHHGMHLVLARSGRMTATIDGAPERCAGVLTPPDVEHAIDCSGTTMRIFFVDPESSSGRRLTRVLDGRARMFDDDERDALFALGGGDDLMPWIRETLAHLDAVDGPGRLVHPKVDRVLALLANDPLSPPPALGDFAERVGLSPSRLMHAFTESTGTTWRAYLRWLRFQRALLALTRGVPLTRTALEAGFHDAAHMTRTFKQMYGLSPSRL